MVYIQPLPLNRAAINGLLTRSFAYFFFYLLFFFNKLDKHIYKKEFLFIGLLWGKFEIDFLGGV